jgi:hypothetical protein
MTDQYSQCCRSSCTTHTATIPLGHLQRSTYFRVRIYPIWLVWVGPRIQKWQTSVCVLRCIQRCSDQQNRHEKNQSQARLASIPRPPSLLSGGRSRPSPSLRRPASLLPFSLAPSFTCHRILRFPSARCPAIPWRPALFQLRAAAAGVTTTRGRPDLGRWRRPKFCNSGAMGDFLHLAAAVRFRTEDAESWAAAAGSWTATVGFWMAAAGARDRGGCGGFITGERGRRERVVV